MECTSVRSNIDGFKYTNDMTITDNIVREHIILDDTTVSKQLIMISLNMKKPTSIFINRSTESINYNLVHNGIYTIIVKPDTKIVLTTNTSDTVTNEIGVSYYGDPIALTQFPYEIVYSFDENYFIGGFASIYSLISNTKRIDDIRFNICVPEKDFERFLIVYSQFVSNLETSENRCNDSKINNKFNISIILVNNLIIDDVFIKTKCIKGGNHLLTISNMSRLLIGQLLDYDLVMYIDADTIVQGDVTTILDKLKNKDLVVSGKMSNLCFKNLLNSKYYNNVSALLKKNINLDRNIIYTGTLFINPRRYKSFYQSILDLVSVHNSLENGLYKLFTMSIINLAIYDGYSYNTEYINNVVDLGCNKNISDDMIHNADVLDWSGINKPWYTNGYYRQYWDKYNLLFEVTEAVNNDKNTVEKTIR